MKNKYIYPVNYINITQSFKSSHKALDLGWSRYHGGKNQDIIATYDGVVYKIDYNSTGGHRILIKHSDNTSSKYCHLDKESIRVKKNDVIKKGQVIAKMGNSGKVTGNHLHFSLYTDGSFRDSSSVNPVDYLYKLDEQLVSSNTEKKYNILEIDEDRDNYKYVIANSLSVRNKPNIKGLKVNNLPYGTKVLVIRQDGSYSMIGNKQYIHSKYISSNKTKVVYETNIINGNRLNIRTTPKISNNKVRELPKQLNKGIIVANMAKENDFIKINNGRWVSSKYVI